MVTVVEVVVDVVVMAAVVVVVDAVVVGAVVIVVVVDASARGRIQMSITFLQLFSVSLRQTILLLVTLTSRLFLQSTMCLL